MEQKEQAVFAQAHASYNNAVGRYWLLRRVQADKILPDECAEISSALKVAESSLENMDLSQMVAAIEKTNGLLAAVQAEYQSAKRRRMHAASEVVACAERFVGISAAQPGARLSRHSGIDPAYSLMRARLALDFEDWQGAEKQARGAIDARLQERQSTLESQQAFPALTESPIEAINPSNGSVQCRVIRLEDLQRLFAIAAKQSISTLKIGVVAEMNILRDFFSKLCALDSKLLDREVIEASPVMLLRAPLLRNVMVYVVGFPIEYYDGSSFKQCLNGFGSTVVFARDLSTLATHESQMTLMCLSQMHRQHVQVGYLSEEGGVADVDATLRQWASVEEVEHDGDRMVEFFRASVIPGRPSNAGANEGVTREAVVQ